MLLAVALAAAQQQPADDPVANPGRPTISTPATLVPVGYLQFETGFLAAWRSPEFSSQSSLSDVVRFSISRRIELLAEAGPYAHSRVRDQASDATGDLLLGFQGVVRRGAGARPTIALSYLGRVHNGSAPNLDIGGPSHSVILLFSADVKGFHYDTNYLFNEVKASPAVRRAQFGQTLSVSHPLGKNFGVSGEVWHFTQPFLRGHAIGALWALNYNLRKNLVLDTALNRGFTGTSTRWELLAGFTYLLPRNLFRR